MNSANSPPPTSVQESPTPPGGAEATTAVTILPPERVQLPAPAKPSAPPELARADLFLTALVVLLAFLVASTPARNSDVWLHLAAGRALGNDGFFGADSATWVGHSWLYDLGSYGVYQMLGGSALVFLKAALFAVLAAVLVRLGSRERAWAWSAGAATVALLALGGRLLLQPALVSALLLALTLGLLIRGQRLRTEENGGWLRAYGPICLLLSLWANLDDWYFLGPLTAGLYLLGAVVATFTGTKERSDLSGLTMLLGAGLVACLLTPLHIHGFTLPTELGLSATARALQEDPVLQGLFVSPFDGTYFQAGAAWSVPGLAYLALAILSGLSFAGSREGWRSWRMPVWLGLFGLSAWSVRAVPFFAVAAAPILALNVQDYLRPLSSRPTQSGDFLRARLGRAAAMLLLLGLLVAAWPGWLQGPPYEMRRWAVLADPSLEAAGRQLADWRDRGLLRADDRGFNFSPEEANYFAWFCPAEKGLVDSRLQVPAAEAADYITVRRALLEGLSNKSDWRDVFRHHGIDHVVLSDTNPERLSEVYRRLVKEPKEWSLLFLRGRIAVFAWIDPERPMASASLTALRAPLRQEACHPAEDRQAPREWPGRGPQPGAWWQAFVTSRPAGSPDRDEAALLLLQFQTQMENTHAERELTWEAGLVAGAAGAGAPTLPAAFQQAMSLFCLRTLHSDSPLELNTQTPKLEHVALAFRNAYFQQQDDAPPELLWLALRAARRALHQDPDDSHAYLILGETYLGLLRNTRERTWVQRLPLISRLRGVQASAALNQALLRQPDLIAAHLALFSLYQDMGLWDLKLKHLREVLRLTEAKGRSPRETPRQWEERLAQFKEDVQRLQADVQRAEDNYEIQSTNRKTIDRAKDARDFGLGGKALELLLASDAASFGQRGVQMELDLLLSTGRVREVREWLLPEHRDTLGEENYLRVRFQLAAACGDYGAVDDELADLAASSDRPINLFGLQMPARQAIAVGVAHELLDRSTQNQSLLDLGMVSFRSGHFYMGLQEYADHLRRAADYTTVRGLMALERGDTIRADDLFHRALEIYLSPEEAASGAGLDFSGRPIAEHFAKVLQTPPQ